MCFPCEHFMDRWINIKEVNGYLLYKKLGRKIKGAILFDFGVFDGKNRSVNSPVINEWQYLRLFDQKVLD